MLFSVVWAADCAVYDRCKSDITNTWQNGYCEYWRERGQVTRYQECLCYNAVEMG